MNLLSLGKSPAPPDLNWGKEWPHAALSFVLILSVYIFTMPKSVTLEDSGNFIMSSFFLGVAHPPGYPLHTLLGSLIIHLVPFGSIAFRMNLLSGICGAASCAMIWIFVRMILKGRIYAYAAAFMFGFSNTLWSLSIITEVYSLNVLMFFIVLNFCYFFSATGSQKALCFAALSLGLGLSNHLHLMLLGVPGLLLVVWPRLRELLIGLKGAIPLFILGLFPYAVMVWRSQANPVVSFYGPIDTFHKFIFFITRQGHKELDYSTSADLHDKLLFTANFFYQCAIEFTPLGLIPVMIGFIGMWKRLRAGVCIGLCAIFLGGGVLLFFLVDYDYDFLNIGVFRVYPLLCYGVMGLWAALGLAWLVEKIPGKVTPPLLCIFFSLSVLFYNYSINNRKNDDYSYRYATTILDSLDKNAILFTHSDVDIGPIGYMNLVENYRPDVEIYNSLGLVFRNRIFNTTSNKDHIRKTFEDFVKSINRPVYLIQYFPSTFGKTHYGLYSKMEKNMENKYINFSTKPDLLEFIDSAIRVEEIDVPFTRYHKNLLLAKYGTVLAPLMLYSKESKQLEQIQPAYKKVSGYFYGKFGMIRSLLNQAKAETLWQWSEEAVLLLDETVLPVDQARFYQDRGHIQNRLGNLDALVENLKKSIEIFPNQKNNAIHALLEIYQKIGKFDEYTQLKNRFH